jgi:hypothetical protein
MLGFLRFAAALPADLQGKGCKTFAGAALFLLTGKTGCAMMRSPLLRVYFFVPIFGCARKCEGGWINR